MNYRRLPLQTLKNARDLGGYPLISGGATLFGRFVRCEAPRELTESDLDFLRRYGITDSVDLRGDSEVKKHPSAFAHLPWIKYRRCPTYDKQAAYVSNSFSDWGEKYIELVENGKSWLRDTLRVIAPAKGAVICNCTTGKDRTGVIAALMLGLAGVQDADIIADYCVSEAYLRESYAQLLERDVDPGSPFLKTAPANMAALLGHITHRYGGVAQLLRECGVSEREAELLKTRLCGEL